MFDLRQFIIAGHEKIIGHYQRLLDSSSSEVERERLRRCIADEQQALQRVLRQGSRVRQAA